MGVGQQKIKESDVTGLKYFNQLAPLLARLHDEGCEKDTANNRKLHYDQYCMLLLLYLFNPDRRRRYEASNRPANLRMSKSKLGCARASLGSLSEATSRFRCAERLKEIIGELGQQLQPLAGDKTPRLTSSRPSYSSMAH